MTSATPERRLLLLRHAKAEQTLGVSDHDRALIPRGRRDAADVGHWLAAHGIRIGLVVCSTALRTRQTWAAAVTGGAQAEHIEYRKQIYYGGTDGVLATIREDGGAQGTVLVVGHAPTMPILADVLSAGAGARAAHEALAAGFPTCALAVLTYAGDWAELAPGTARLEHFYVGRG